MTGVQEMKHSAPSLVLPDVWLPTSSGSELRICIADVISMRHSLSLWIELYFIRTRYGRVTYEALVRDVMKCFASLGSGRQSLTRLATRMAEFVCFQIELGSNHGPSEWTDIKTLMFKAGVYSVGIVLLISDPQVSALDLQTMPC
jgi:hypothetical protein